MPKGLQKHNLKKALKARGIAPDTIDLEALVDSDLEYGENEARVFKKARVPDRSDGRETTHAEPRGNKGKPCVDKPRGGRKPGASYPD